MVLFTKTFFKDSITSSLICEISKSFINCFTQLDTGTVERTGKLHFFMIIWQLLRFNTKASLLNWHFNLSFSPKMIGRFFRKFFNTLSWS